MTMIELIIKPWFFIYGLACSFLSIEVVWYQVYWPLIVLIPCALYGFYRSEIIQTLTNKEDAE